MEGHWVTFLSHCHESLILYDLCSDVTCSYMIFFILKITVLRNYFNTFCENKACIIPVMHSGWEFVMLNFYEGPFYDHIIWIKREPKPMTRFVSNTTIANLSSSFLLFAIFFKQQLAKLNLLGRKMNHYDLFFELRPD